MGKYTGWKCTIISLIKGLPDCTEGYYTAWKVKSGEYRYIKFEVESITSYSYSYAELNYFYASKFELSCGSKVNLLDPIDGKDMKDQKEIT